jgi:hypothetical protein
LRFNRFFVMPPVYKWCKRNSLEHNHVKNGMVGLKKNKYFILFYSILQCILFYSVIFYFILFYFILFCSILFYYNCAKE